MVAQHLPLHFGICLSKNVLLTCVNPIANEKQMQAITLFFTIFRSVFDSSSPVSFYSPLMQLIQALLDFIAYYFRKPCLVNLRTGAKVSLTITLCVQFYIYVDAEIRGTYNQPLFGYFVNLVANIIGVIAGIALTHHFKRMNLCTLSSNLLSRDGCCEKEIQGTEAKTVMQV